MNGVDYMRARRGGWNVPENVVVVLVIDYGRNTPVGVELCVFGFLLVATLEVEVNGLVRESEIVTENGDFPKAPGEYVVLRLTRSFWRTHHPLGPPT